MFSLPSPKSLLTLTVWSSGLNSEPWSQNSSSVSCNSGLLSWPCEWWHCCCFHVCLLLQSCPFPHDLWSHSSPITQEILSILRLGVRGGKHTVGKHFLALIFAESVLSTQVLGPPYCGQPNSSVLFKKNIIIIFLIFDWAWSLLQHMGT